MPPATRDVELTDVGGAGAAGEEGDDVPLLRNRDAALPSSEPSPAGPAHVYPRPNSSYTRDGRSWASKLVFSWIDPVLDKVRRISPSRSCIRLQQCGREMENARLAHMHRGTAESACYPTHTPPTFDKHKHKLGQSRGNPTVSPVNLLLCESLSLCGMSLSHRWRMSQRIPSTMGTPQKQGMGGLGNIGYMEGQVATEAGALGEAFVASVILFLCWNRYVQVYIFRLSRVTGPRNVLAGQFSYIFNI